MWVEIMKIEPSKPKIEAIIVMMKRVSCSSSEKLDILWLIYSVYKVGI